jgi:hypothetical protein
MPKIVKANGKTFTFDDNVTNDQISSTIDEYFGVKKKEVSQPTSQKTPSVSKSKRTTTPTSSVTEKTQVPAESDGLGGTPNINIPVAVTPVGGIPLAIPALFSEATKTVFQAADDALVTARKALQEQGFFDDDIPDTKTPISDAIKKKVLSKQGELKNLPNGIQQMKNQETGVLNPAPYIKGAAELGLKIINSTLPQEQKNVIISALNLGDSYLKNNIRSINKVQDYALPKDNIPVNIAKNIIGMAPDLVVAAAMENPTVVEGRLAKMATEATKNAKPILQKLVPKTAKFIEEAVNAPFTKIMAAKGTLSSVANAKEGENIVDKGFEGGLEGAAEGVYMHTLGAAAGKVMPFIAKGVSKLGADSAFATAIANPLANAGVFTTARALRKGIEEQKLITPEEIAMEAGTGLGFSLLHAGSLFKNHNELNHYADNTLKTSKLDAFKRVVNETKDNLDLVYNPNLTEENISKLEEARDDLKSAILKEPDLQNKQILINEALKIQNQLDAHSAINDIVNNKESLIDTVNSNESLDENQKEFYTKKIEAIADYFDNSEFGLKKKELNAKIDETQKLLDDASNKFTNRKSASDGIEAKIEVDKRREELDKLNTELTDLITNKLKPTEEVVIEETKPTTVQYNDTNYTKNENGVWINEKTGNEVKGIGEKGKELINNLEGLTKPIVEVISPETSSNYANLTENKNGDFVFFHVGGKGYEKINKSTGGTTATSKEEAAALSKVGGVAMYYTKPGDTERMVNGEAKYAVTIPKEKVYDANTDPNNYTEQAKVLHEEEHPGKAFDANTKLAYITKIAGENGYDMVVSEWQGKTRAQTTTEFAPTDVELKEGAKIVKPFEEEYIDNSKKGLKSIIPESKDAKLKAVYDQIYTEKNTAGEYDDLYRLSSQEAATINQDEVTKLIEEDKTLSQDTKNMYAEALSYEPEQRRTVSIVGETVKVDNAPEGHHLNVGLLEGRTNKKMSAEDVLSKLPKDIKVISSTEIKGTEPSISTEISRPLTSSEMNKFLEDTKQQAVAQLSDKNGILYDAKRGTSEGWGEFNPELFVTQDGKNLTEVKAPEVKPTIKSKLEAFKAKHIEKPVYDRTKLDTQVENAKKSLAKVLPDVKFVVHDTRESFIKEAGKNARGYYDPATGTIHINALEANARTVAHEVFHSVLLDKVKTDANARDLTKRMIDSVSKTLEGNPELKKTLDDFVKNYDENIQSEEKVAELFGHLADGYEGFDAPAKSIIKRAMDRLAKMFGLQPFTEGEVVDMLKTLASKVSTGEEIVAKDTEIIKEQKTIKDAVKKFQADFIDPRSKVEFVYDKNTEKFKKLEEEGYITKDKSIEDFNGQTIFLHQPDAAFSGEIYKNGESLVEGKGGVYYPIKFHDDGYFWASTETTANKMAKDLNAAREANGGKLLMALTSAPSDKLLSSTTAANGVMEIILSKAFDRSFSLNKEQVKKSLVDAANKVVEIEGKKVGLGLGLKKGATLEDVKSEIAKKLNPDNSSFADRKAFVKSFISNIADIVKQNPKAVDQFGKFFSEGIKNESFKGVTKTGKLSISAANMTQAISEMLTEPMLKEGIDRNKGGQVYAILELDGDVKPIDSNKHESYPKAIQSVDPNNKVKLHILKDRVQWSDVFEDPTTGDIVTKERQLNIFPTSGVSTEGLKLNTNKGRLQESEDYSDMKEIVKDMIDDGMSITEIKKTISSELGPDQVSLAERAHNELTSQPKTTSIKNEVVSAEREAKGLAPVEQRDTYSTKVNYDETKAKVDSGEISPRDLATTIIQNPTKVAITSEVSDALAYDRMRLSNEYDKVVKAIVEDPTDQSNIIARDRLEKQMEDNDRASKYSGTISSHALLARKNVIKQDYSLDRLIMRYKAETGGKISEDMRAKFDVLSTKLQEANAKLEQYESKIADRQVKAEFEKIKRNADKEVRSNKRSAAKESLKAEREDLYAKLKEIQREQMSRLSANPLPLEMVPVISKLAKNLIKDGIVTLDGVVDEIHSNVKDVFEDITKRDIRDALSGYGKFKLPTKDEVAAQLREIKSQAKLVSALEDAESGKMPLKTGFSRSKASETVTELRKKVQEVIKQNGINSENLPEEKVWKSPEEKALKALKTRLKNREKELQGMIDSGNFEKKPRNITVLDSEANQLKADIERIKNKVDIEIKKERLKNRTKVEKVTDFVTTWRRNLLLTGVKVLGKLTAAAGQRTLISPIEELVGGVLSKLPILSKVAEKSPREGGINAKAEVKAISQWWQKATYKDMREIVKSGKGALDLLHGKKTDLPPSVFDFFGQMHQALKQPAKRNEYFRSFEKRLAHAQRNGVDISDPLVQATIGTQAYLDANRAIFMQENAITTAYKSAVNTLERAGDSGKVVAGMLKVILPIVKVPTNFANEVTSYAVGGLKGLLVLRNGIKNLTTDQADYVMRNLKKQSLGAAVIALGYFLSGSIGGFYQRGDKREEDDVQAGGLRVLGVDMPKWMIHTPLLEMLQIGATLKRVQDDYENKEKEGTAASVLAATKGVVEEVPFARSPEEALKALSSPDNFKKYFRDLGESMINPQLTKEMGLEVLPKENKEEESYGKETGVRK